ncbi:hypothetical protein [Gracilibacillus xinjiangensis]|uniref:Uncharacterized protein n=1 Tax=Gracilibacillus xinjiangensis TaxID=1193282 RepID=A0ABV8WRC3_9BACI
MLYYGSSNTLSINGQVNLIKEEYEGNESTSNLEAIVQDKLHSEFGSAS